MSKDLYRRVRRLQRRGPRAWTIHREPKDKRLPFAQVRDEQGKSVSDSVPVGQVGKVDKSLRTGQPVLVRLFRLNRSGAFTERPSRGVQFEIARRLEWIRFTEGKPLKEGR